MNGRSLGVDKLINFWVYFVNMNVLCPSVDFGIFCQRHYTVKFDNALTISLS